MGIIGARKNAVSPMIAIIERRAFRFIVLGLFCLGYAVETFKWRLFLLLKEVHSQSESGHEDSNER